MRSAKNRLHTVITTAVFLFLVPLAFAEENLSAKDVLSAFLSRGGGEGFSSVDKEKVKEELKKEFDVSDEDLLFLSSIRNSRLPLDGFDFYTQPKALMQLVSIYMEARVEWNRPIDPRFYDFFKQYAEKRLGKTEAAVEQHYQIEYAKKRFSQGR